MAMGDVAVAVPTAERTFVQNEFGTVTDRRVVFFRAKGWISGGSREDIPLQHVTSVRLDISRKLILALPLLFAGLGALGGSTGVGAKLIGILLLAWAGLLLWGSPSVVVNTAGRDLVAAKGVPWQRANATAFVEALRQQLFSKPGA